MATEAVILIPGIMGSVLEQNGHDAWALSLSALVRVVAGGRDLSALELKGDSATADDLGDGVVPARLLSDVSILPGIWKVDGYDNCARQIMKSLSLDAKRCLSFPYDWRRDNRHSARRLQALVTTILAGKPADAKVALVCHSMGGLVARHWLEVLGGWRQCGAVITIGTPHRGSLGALQALSAGVSKKLGPLTLFDVTKTIRSFTALYQLLPIYPCVDVQGRMLRVTETAIPGLDPAKARDAIAFHREIQEAVQANLADPKYVQGRPPLYPVVGTCQPTLQSAKLAGQLEFRTEYEGRDMDGDGTVPRVSATPIELSDQHREVFTAGRHATLQNVASVLEQVRGAISGGDIDLRRFRAPAVRLGLAIEDAYFADERIRVRVKPTTDSAVVRATVQRSDGGGSKTQGRLIRGSDGWHLVDLSPQPPGTYRVRVEANGAEPVEDLFVVVAQGAPARKAVAFEKREVSFGEQVFYAPSKEQHPTRAMPPAPRPLGAAPPVSAPPAAAPPVGAEAPPRAEAKPAATELRRHPSLDATAVVPGKPVVIKVALRQAESAGTLASPVDVTLAPGETSIQIDTSVRCDQIDFEGDGRGRITVSADADGAPLEFRGKVKETARLLEEIEVRASFYVGARICGMAVRAFPVEGAAAPQQLRAAPQPTAGGLRYVAGPQPALLTVQIARRQTQPRTFDWEIRIGGVDARKLDPLYRDTISLDDDPAVLIGNLFHVIQSQTGGDAVRLIQSVGEKLYDLTPACFKKAYADVAAAAGGNLSQVYIQFITDEVEIPWELMRMPRGPHSGYQLCTEHPVARWLYDYANWLPWTLPEGSIVAAAPDYQMNGLPWAQKERDALEKSFGASSIVHATKDQILQLFEGNLAGVQLKPGGPRPQTVALFHFAGHGEFDQDVAQESRILLEDNDLHVADVDRRETALGDQGTVVFLNACQSGQTSRPFGLTTGWASAFVARKFGGFIAPLWSVEDQGAFALVPDFYDLVFNQKKRISEALMMMRKKSASPTWMSYVYYGDVMAGFPA